MNFYAHAAKEIVTLSASTLVLKTSTLNNNLAIVNAKTAAALLTSDEPKVYKKSWKPFKASLRQAQRARNLRNLAEKIHPFPTK
jgi:hypothetical protein